MMNRLRRIKTLLRFDNWIELLVSRAFFRHTRFVTYRIQGITAVVDHRSADAGSIVYCLATDSYTQFLDKMDLSRPMRVVDIGANAGGFSLLLKMYGCEIERLLCVEMNPNTHARLLLNIQTNFGNTATVVNAAVCADRRTIQLDLGEGSTGDSIYRGTRGERSSTAPYQIQGMTFDDAVEMCFKDEVIDICKIDIEGAEVEVLADPRSKITCLRRCRYILIELHPVEHYDTFIEVAQQGGFELVAHEGKSRCGVHLFRNVKIDERTRPAGASSPGTR